MTPAGSRKVMLSDLDIVSHANSVKYLEWCLDAINPGAILKQRLKSFDMNYLREVMLNDEVHLYSCAEDKQTLLTVNKGTKPCFALELNWK